MQSIIRVGWGKSDPRFRQVFTGMLAPGATEEQRDWFDELMRTATDPEMALKLRAAWNRVDVTDRLRECRAPALVAHARDDAAIPFEEGRLVASGIPDARFLPLESSNHVLLPNEPAWEVFVREMRRFLGVTPVSRPFDAELTDRELQVLRLAAEGKSNATIAGRLYLSPRTVERHLSNIYAKLGLSGKSARAAATSMLDDLERTADG
jgi:DNA-binding NarL/FixJ family response regulator